MRILVGIESEAELRGDDDLVAHWRERFTDHLLIYVWTVHLGGIEEVDAAIDGSPHDRNHVLLAACYRTMTRAHPHAAQSNG